MRMFCKFYRSKLWNQPRLHHVPVLNEDIPDLGELTFQDLTASAIIPEIDGNKHVKRICGEKVSPEVGFSILKVLLHL